MILINSSSRKGVGIFQPFLPAYVPTGVGWLLGVAKRDGINFRYVDEQIEPNILPAILRHVHTMQKPYIFGFSVVTDAFNRAIIVSRKLKDLFPDSIICFGGIHPTAMPDEALDFDHVDYVIKGEAEHIIVDFVKCLKEKRSVEHLDGLSYRKQGRIVHNEQKYILDLDCLPLFPYQEFDFAKYDLGFIISSRGCPYQCIYCSNRVATGKTYRFRKNDHIMEEIKLLYHHFGKRHIYFFDDNFLVEKQRVLELLEEIKRVGLDKKIEFSFQARGDNVGKDILTKLYSAGFKYINIGIESGSERMLKVIKKGETLSKMFNSVRLAKKIGFHVTSTFIFGFPKETHEDRKACFKLSKDLNLDMVKYNNAIPYPGTEFFAIAKKEKRLNKMGLYENFNAVATFSENPFKKTPFPYIPEYSTEEEIRADILWGYVIFYCNFGKLRKIFLKPKEGQGWFSAGDNICQLLLKLPSVAWLLMMILIKYCKLFIYIIFKTLKENNKKNIT